MDSLNSLCTLQNWFHRHSFYLLGKLAPYYLVLVVVEYEWFGCWELCFGGSCSV